MFPSGIIDLLSTVAFGISSFHQFQLNDQLSLKANVPSFAICVPNQCTEEDVNSITSEYTLNFKCETKEDLDVPLPTGTKLTL